MKLLLKLNPKLYCNELHKSLIAVILLYLAFKYPVITFCLVLYIIYLIKDKTQIILSFSLILIFIILNLYYIGKTDDILPSQLEATVVDIDEEYIIIKYDNYNILAYTNNEFNIGDVIYVKLKYQDIRIKSYKTDFDLKEYYYTKKIFHIAKIEEYKLLDNKFIINSIKYNIIKYYENNLSENSFLYVKAIVLGINDLEDDLKDGYSILGISHILAISGLHIMLLFKVLSYIFKRYLNIVYNLIPILIITIYVIVIGMPPSCLRALLYLIIGTIDKYKTNRFTKLDILSISFIITLFIRPYIFYNTSFILTYLVSFILCFSNDLIKVKSKLLYNYLIYILIYFITFPITIGINNYVSITSFILSPILTILATYTVIPLSFIVFLIPKLNIVIEPIFNFINLYINTLGNIKIGFDFISFTFIFKIIYFILYFLVLINISKGNKLYKSLSIFIIYLILINNISYINLTNKVTFINCGQGDSCLVEIGNKKVLIDAYGCYDYLVDRRINKIDYIVLTHSDNDHIEDIFKILEYADVNNVIYPKYDNFDNKEFQMVESDDKFIVNGVNFNILSPIKDLNDLNANSISLQFKLDGITYLFCGDITVETEKLLIEKYQKRLKSDVLKVAHHGSNSSSSIEFIKMVNPKYSIVSVKKNNIYNLPNEEVITRLKKYSNVLLTYKEGNITFTSYNNYFNLTTYSSNNR